MWASINGHLEVVCTLLEGKADINAKTNVRNQLMMMILTTIIIMMMLIITMLVLFIMSV